MEIIKAVNLLQLGGSERDKGTKKVSSLGSASSDNLLSEVLTLLRFPPAPHSKSTRHQAFHVTADL